jgi:hypothetical protein
LAALIGSPGWSAIVDSGPQPPCATEPSPAYPEADEAPVVKVWESGELGKEWRPPACTGWEDTGFSTLVVTAARFRYPAGHEELLRRIGAISGLKGLAYWSTTHQQWKPLIVDAFALSGPTGNQRRPDFSPEELVEGRHVFFAQEDSLSGKGIYEMRTDKVSSESLVFEATNINTMRYLMVPIFHPGDVQSIYFLERETDSNVWRYYNILRTGKNANMLTAGHAASSINRAVAFYRHLAGIPADREPPAAR